MRRIARILLAVWGMLTLAGCDHEAVKVLERAEAYLPAEADSAAMCLDSIRQMENLDDAERAWYGLLRTYADNRLDKGVKSDSLIRDSYEYYRDASHSGKTSDKTLLRHYAQSCYYMALYYSSSDSTKQCEDMLHQAIKGSEECEDWHTCYLAYTQLGIATRWGNNEYAKKQAFKALEIYYRINDDVDNEVRILGKIAGLFIGEFQPDSALKYYTKAYELAEKNHLAKERNWLYSGLSYAYVQKEDYVKALDYAKRGIATANSTELVPSLENLELCYMFCDSLAQAKEILKSMSYDSTAFLDRYCALREMSEIAAKTHDYDSLFIYVDSAYECLEQRFFHAQRVKDEYYQDNLAKQIEKEKIQHEAEMSRWIGGAVILFVLLIASFIIYTVLRHKKRMEADHQKEMLHKQEIIHQKSMTLAVLRKHLVDKLEHTRQLLSDSEDTYMTKEAWDEMEQLINDTDNQFVKTLRRQHKEFREEDIQLCMLVRLKTDNSVIAKIYHIGVDAVKKRKLTLKKNGFHITDPDTSLEDVIAKMY